MLKLVLSNLSAAVFHLCLNTLRFIRLSLRSHLALAAENLFLRKQVALYLERQVKPRRAKVGTRLTLVLLSKLFVWRVLKVEIEAPRTAAGSHRTPEIGRGDG